MDIEFITRRFFLPDASLKADVAIVFGMNDWRRPTARAIEIYQAGQAQKLLFTGGYNARLCVVEAREMAAYARAQGVSESDILVEPEAVHTDDNVLFSRNLIEARFGRDAVRSVLMVTIHYHLARTLIAARRYFAGDVQIGWATYPSLYYSGADWHKIERGRRDVEAEIGKIEKYYALRFEDVVRDGPWP